MKVVHDPDANILQMVFGNVPVEESDEDKPGVILDYDALGNIIGVEILDARKPMENPRRVEYAVTEGRMREVECCEFGVLIGVLVGE